jgi:hypothetical protein
MDCAVRLIVSVTVTVLCSSDTVVDSVPVIDALSVTELVSVIVSVPTLVVTVGRVVV